MTCGEYAGRTPSNMSESLPFEETAGKKKMAVLPATHCDSSVV